MKRRYYLILVLLGLGLALAVAQFERFPGYLDSDYYFAGGIQLAQGKGFTEPYLWNYLDDPRGLPHPSHGYWMPLSSIVAAAGMWATRQTTYQAGRLGFLLLAAFVPVVTAALAYSFCWRTNLAFVSGLLAVFSVYYAPFLPVTDNYGPYLILGGLFFLIAQWRKPAAYFALGMLSALLTLARSDGVLWLGLAFLLVLWRFMQERQLRPAAIYAALALAGFLLLSGAWFWHAYETFGSAFAPGGRNILWIRNYDETFLYPASQLTYQHWIAQGWGSILQARLGALRWNLLNALAAQGEIFLLPFMLVGLWALRHEERIRLAGIAWSCLLVVMTVIFPFAGQRGGFFHSGAALQPLWWSMAPIGLDRAIQAARRRNLFTPAASRIFQGAMVGIAVLMTGVILYLRVLPGWGEGEQNYPRVEAFLKGQGIESGDIVMVRNPPGYYLMTARSTIVVPYGDEATMLAVARRYHARFLVLEAAGAAGPMRAVYDNKESPNLIYLGELDQTRIFKVKE